MAAQRAPGGKPWDGPDAKPPAWTTGKMERPEGREEENGCTMAVFTEEQQKRLNVNKWGEEVKADGVAGGDTEDGDAAAAAGAAAAVANLKLEEKEVVEEEEAVDAGGGTTIGAVADEVANASAEDKAAAVAMEYANYLDSQRENGWKD